MRSTKLALTVALALAGCGDNRLLPNGVVHHDSGNPDAQNFPPPPTLGAQIDRAGRPLISTALIGVFAPAGAARNAMKDAYNHAADPAMWRTTPLQTNVSIEIELETNLAVFDVLDQRLQTNSGPLPGCGNALKYALPATVGLSYLAAADLFADDQLYVDTSKATCNAYFALELEYAAQIPHTTCGGRTLTHDVIDVTYSVLAAGFSGLDRINANAPRITDGVSAHATITPDTFPYLGRPN